MIGASSATRILLAREPADMRKGPDGLCEIVRRHFDESEYSGTLFVFLSRRADRAKVLWWSHGGFVVLYKRLERGRFRAPKASTSGQVSMTPAELEALLEGIDLSGARRAPLWVPRAA